MADVRIVLDRADYWELRTRIRDIDVARLELANTRARSAAVLARLAQQHGFDPAGEYAFDDEACALVGQDSCHRS